MFEQAKTFQASDRVTTVIGRMASSPFKMPILLSVKVPVLPIGWLQQRSGRGRCCQYHMGVIKYDRPSSTAAVVAVICYSVSAAILTNLTYIAVSPQ
jgi:hypothetical protein